jgi:hypothetical protein
LAQRLSNEGAYSDGSGPGAAPALPGHGEFRLEQFLELPQPIGDAEQYSAAMDLMATSLGLPARVVLGVQDLRSGTHTYYGRNVTAWVEIDFAGIGWYPFYPTPPVTAQVHAMPPPAASNSSNQSQYQSPPSPLHSSSGVGANAVTSSSLNHKRSSVIKDIGHLLEILGVVVAVAVIISSPALLIARAKTRRRSRRRRSPAPRVRMEGGWAEIVDYARDVGAPLPHRATRLEMAGVIGGATLSLAQSADRASFGPDEPGELQASQFWTLVDRTLADMRANLSSWARIRATLSLRSLVPADWASRLRHRIRQGNPVGSLANAGGAPWATVTRRSGNATA